MEDWHRAHPHLRKALREEKEKQIKAQEGRLTKDNQIPQWSLTREGEIERVWAAPELGTDTFQAQVTFDPAGGNKTGPVRTFTKAKPTKNALHASVEPNQKEIPYMIVTKMPNLDLD